MSDTYLSSSLNLSAPIADGPPRVRWPFWSEGDATTIVVEQDYKWTFARYAPLALNTPLNIGELNPPEEALPATAAGCIFLEDSEPAPAEAGLCAFTRTWGTVPLSRTQPASLSVSYPGLVSSPPTINVLSAVSIMTSTGTVTSGSSNVVGAAAIGSKVYGVFYGRFLAQSGFGTFSESWFFATRNNKRVARIASLSPFAVTGDNNYLPTIADFGSYQGYQLASIAFRGWTNLFIPGREPRSRLVTGYNQYSYFVGRQAAQAAVVSKFETVDSSGNVSDSVTTTTTPSISDWRRELEGTSGFPSDDSQVSRYRGDIYEVVTPYAPYK